MSQRVFTGVGVVGVLLVGISLLMGLASPLGNVRSYEVTCATSATKISDGAPTSIVNFWNNSATPAFIGGSDVTSTTKGTPFCTDTATCQSAGMAIEVSSAGIFCLSTGGAVVLDVLAGR